MISILTYLTQIPSHAYYSAEKMMLSADFGCSLLNKDAGIGVLHVF